LTELTGRDSPL